MNQVNHPKLLENESPELKSQISAIPTAIQPFFINSERPLQTYEKHFILLLGGFELFDLIFIAIYRSESDIMFVHHIGFISASLYLLDDKTGQNIYGNNATGQAHFFWICAYFALITNIFLNLRWFTKFYGKQKLDNIISKSFFVIYIVLRIFIGNWIYFHQISSGMIYNFDAYFQWVLHFTTGLNLVFLWQILSVLFRSYV